MTGRSAASRVDGRTQANYAQVMPKFAAFVMCLMLVSCATSQPLYRPAASDTATGYREVRISDDHWRVHFAGRPGTPRDRVELLLLYRAAALTQSAGRNWFEIVHRSSDTDVRTWGTPPHRHALVTRHGVIYDPFWLYGASPPYRETRHTASAEIRMGNGPAPERAGVYVAAEVLQRLDHAGVASR